MENKRLEKYEKILILTVFFGFLFRLINVNTRVLLGDPPHFLIEAINFFNSGLLIIWDQSAYLWYAFTNIFYTLFGITQFASRFSSLLFGTLSIVAIYLFTYEFSKNKRLALITSILFAFAPGIIWQTADEHDMSALFFIIMTFYTLLIGLNKKSKFYLYSSAILFGVSCMWKAYVIILLIPYVGLILYSYKKQQLNLKKSYSFILIAFLIIFAVVAPTTVYNYLNYKHNKVVDFLFAKSFHSLRNDKIQQLYGWTLGQELNTTGNIFYRVFVDGNPTSSTNNNPIIYYGITQSLLSNGPVLWLLALIGLVLMFFHRKKNSFAKDYFVFFSLYFFIPFFVLIDGNYLSKHYIHFLAFALPIVAYLLINFCDSVLFKLNSIRKLTAIKYWEYISLFLIVLFVFFVLLSRVTTQWGVFLSKNPQNEFMKFKFSNIGKDSLIIYDDRIYNSEAAWLFNDRYYLPVSYLNQFLELNQKSQNTQEVSVFVIECGIDQCGWPITPEYNKTMEGFFSSLNNSLATQVAVIDDKVSGVSYYNPLISKGQKTEPYLKIYRTSMPIDLNLAQEIKLQYEYFLYPLGYLNKNSNTYKNFLYQPATGFEKIINSFAWFVFYLDILISFLAILFLIYEVYSRRPILFHETSLNDSNHKVLPTRVSTSETSIQLTP